MNENGFRIFEAPSVEHSALCVADAVLRSVVFRTSLVVVIAASCVPGSKSPKSEPVMLGYYVDAIQKDSDHRHIGRIPSDLSESAVSKPGDHDHSEAVEATPSSVMVPVSMEYAGETADSICFVYTDLRAASNKEPASDAAKQYTDSVVGNANNGVWLEAVDSLESLDAREPWPPGPASVRFKTVAVVSDEPITTTTQENVHGGYIDVKHDYRAVAFRFCGAKPVISPSAKFLVAVGHRPDSADDLKSADPDSDTPEVAAHFKHQNNALFVWKLNDDAKGGGD